MPDEPLNVIVGVDTHADTHTAVALDEVGRRLDSVEIDAAETGYCRLREWAGDLGEVTVVGIEGTGSYGAGLARFLSAAGVEVIGDFLDDGEHEAIASLHYRFGTSATARLGVGVGLTDESPDFTLRTGLVWRF